MNKPELILFAYLPLSLQASRIIRRLQHQLGYIHPIDRSHITVYMCKFSDTAYHQLLAKLEELSPAKVEINLSHLVSKPSKNGGWFYYLKIKNPQLVQLHKTILKLANPLRGTLQRSKELKRIKAGVYSAAELYYLQTYGYLEVLDRYNPHITLGDSMVIDKEKEDALKQTIKRTPTQTQLKELRVGLYSYDGHYTKLKEKTYKMK
jgi:2'-5' RNA ligase